MVSGSEMNPLSKSKGRSPAGRVQPALDSGKNGLDLRAKYQSIALLSVEERFLAQAIASEEQTPRTLRPHRDANMPRSLVKQSALLSSYK